MVWETVSRAGKKVAGFQQWPNPINGITNLNVLMCNRDYWLADVEFLGLSAAEFFWTNFVPSPRELERKSLLGSYKCGFFINDGFRSPLEKLWGASVQRALVEIVNPFVTALWYAWAASTVIDALAIWQTVMFPQAFCDPFVGNYMYKGAHAFASSGISDGSVGLGSLVYDPHHYGNDFVADMSVPPGITTMNVYWTFDAAGPGFNEIRTGFLVGGTKFEVSSHGPLLPGGALQVSRTFTFEDNASGHDIAPYWYGDCPVGGGLNVVSAVRVIGQHDDVTPDRPQPKVLPPYGTYPPRPHCASQYL